jgi:hypothetical protein
VSICRRRGAGDGEVIYQADIYDKSVTFGLARLPLAAGDDLYFTVQAYNAAGGSGNGISDSYRLHATVWVHADGWRRGVPWVKIGGVWRPANLVHLKVQENWRAVP